ncbi:MAG: hypothetical protein ABGX16_11760 [Pirellulales bacterium]
MSAGRTQQQVMQREYLPVRAKILEIAAALDRIDRASAKSVTESKTSESESSREQLQQALGVLLQSESGRAERVQKIFSLPYDQKWQQAFGLSGQ